MSDSLGLAMDAQPNRYTGARSRYGLPVLREKVNALAQMEILRIRLNADAYASGEPVLLSPLSRRMLVSA